MHRFKKILLVVGEEPTPDHAFTRAHQLAQRNGAALTVVSVVSDLYATARWLPSLSYEVLEEVALETCQKKLERLVAPLRAQDMAVTTRVLCGTPFLEIVRLVLQEGHDLVMATATMHGGVREWVLGSDAMHLLRKCPCPVWLVPPTGPGPYGRILAAVDASSGGEAAPPLHDKIIALAHSLAKQEGGELHIAHAWTLYGESLLRGPRLRLSEQRVAALLEEARMQHQGWLEETLTGHAFNGQRPHLHLLNGPPAEVLPLLAREIGAELVVMGTIGRTGVPGLLIGNTAEEVLRRIPCGVLALKPDGWLSPIQPH